MRPKMSIAAAFTLALLTAVLLLPLKAMSQAAAPPAAPPPAAPPAPAPGVPTPPDFPQYIVTPRDDLNPYDLSTMQKSTESGNRGGTGTLGTTPEQSSNIEINEVLSKSRQERLKASQKQVTEEQAEDAAEVEVDDAAEEQAEDAAEEEATTAAEAGVQSPSQAEGPQSDDLSTPGVRGSLFTWTDENGVLHATNDLGQIPIEYQIEALENSKRD